MDPLTTSPFVCIALGCLGLFVLLILMRRTTHQPNTCLMCGRRVNPGEYYCPRHDSDL